MAIIVTFFALHWISSIFAQTFFLHRYASHAMFTMSRFWEKTFHLFTIIAQGPSYLNPYGYAILHRMHHAYSDTEKDPHSPLFSANVAEMMMKTKHTYDNFAYNRVKPQSEFEGNIPVWPVLDTLGQSWFFRIGFGSLYAFFYIAFVPEGQWGWYLLLPVHWLMGPIHGSIVNWGGHKYGYVNHTKTKDHSRNMLPIDFLTIGELYQNNHHGHPTSPNFAFRWFEIDFCYQFMKILHRFNIISIEREIWTPEGKKPVLKEALAS